MDTDHEQKVAKASAAFDRLYAKESGVRRLTEATRANDADTYDPAATLHAFNDGLERGVARLGQVSKLFTDKEK